MTRIDLHLVKALVVARWRELAAQWLQNLLMLLLLTIVAGGSFALRGSHGILVVRAVLSAFLGMYIGYFTNVPLFSWSSTDLPTTGGSEVARALPVSILCRRLAALVIATSAASPFLLIVLGISLLTHKSPQTIVVVIGAVVFGYVINGPLSRGNSLRFVRSQYGAWLSKLSPARDTEVGAAFWTLLPGQLAITLSMPLLGASIYFFLNATNPDPDDAFSIGLARRLAMFLGSLGSTTSGLTLVLKPLATTAVSRRAISIAELRLTPILIAISLLWTIALAGCVAQSEDLAWHGVRVAFSLGFLGAVLRIAFARVATPSTTWGSWILPVLVPLGMDFFTKPDPPISLDTISVVAFLVAVLLAYTAPNTPLSRKPGGLTSVFVRKVGAR